jgi:predicted Fe-Mo cluster-binding NifX family protein
MIIALSVWNERIAPVFDVAVQLLLVEVQDKKVINESLERLPSGSILEISIRLKQLGINTLICGAVSEQVQSFLDLYGINVASFVSGDVQRILQAWLSGNFNETDFAMPGCERQKRCENGQQLRCRSNRKLYK